MISDTDSGFRIQDSGYGFRIQDSGFRIQDSGFRIQDSGFRIQDSGFRIQDSGFRIQDSGFRIQDSGFRIQDTDSGKHINDHQTVTKSFVSSFQTLKEDIEKNSFYIYVHAPAGCGKTVILKKVEETVNTFFEDEKASLITGSTGGAAVEVGGKTLHSTFRISPNEEEAFCEMSAVTYAILRKTLAKARVLFVEEVSMVSALLFAQSDAQLQLSRGNSKPFGGLSVLLFGDLLQLPPVSGNAIFHDIPEEFKSAREARCPATPQNLWKLFRMLKLHHNERTTDEEEARILMEIREERLTEESERFLRRWCWMGDTTAKGIFEEVKWMKIANPGMDFAIIAPRNETVNHNDNWEALMEVSTSDATEKIIGDKTVPTTPQPLHYRIHTGERPFNCSLSGGVRDERNSEDTYRCAPIEALAPRPPDFSYTNSAAAQFANSQSPRYHIQTPATPRIQPNQQRYMNAQEMTVHIAEHRNKWTQPPRVMHTPQQTRVQLDSRKEVFLEKKVFTNGRQYWFQFPVAMAETIAVNKSQMMTYDGVIVITARMPK